MKRLGKKVQFHGIDIFITMPYVAVDSNGGMFEYEEEPEVIGVDAPAWSSSGSMAILCDVDLEGLDWKETLLRFDV